MTETDRYEAPKGGAMKFRKKPVEIEAKAFHGGAQSATLLIDWILENGGTARYQEFVPASESGDGQDGIPAIPEHIAIRHTRRHDDSPTPATTSSRVSRASSTRARVIYLRQPTRGSRVLPRRPCTAARSDPLPQAGLAPSRISSLRPTSLSSRD